MAPGPPSWIGPPSIPTSPPPRPESLRTLKRNASNRNNDPTRPQGPDYSLWKGYQESMGQDDRKETQMEADDTEGQSLPEQGERIWRRQQRRRRESAFTSGSQLPSYPGLPPSRLPARRRKRPEEDPSRFNSSARAGVAFRKCLCEFFVFKPLLTPPLLQVTKGIKETSIISHCHLFSLVLVYSTSLTSFFRFLPSRSSLWAPVRGRLTRWNRMAGAESSHGVLGPVVKVTRVRQRWS